jgi:phage head maturation protease
MSLPATTCCTKEECGYQQKQIRAYAERFKSLSTDEQQQITDAINRDPFLQVIDDSDMRVCAYMMRCEQYKIGD